MPPFHWNWSRTRRRAPFDYLRQAPPPRRGSATSCPAATSTRPRAPGATASTTRRSSSSPRPARWAWPAVRTRASRCRSSSSPAPTARDQPRHDHGLARPRPRDDLRRVSRRNLPGPRRRRRPFVRPRPRRPRDQLGAQHWRAGLRPDAARRHGDGLRPVPRPGRRDRRPLLERRAAALHRHQLAAVPQRLHRLPHPPQLQPRGGPQARGVLHLPHGAGPPQLRGVHDSKHGSLYAARGHEWDWSRPLAEADWGAPTCAYCHMLYVDSITGSALLQPQHDAQDHWGMGVQAEPASWTTSSPCPRTRPGATR